MSVATILVTKMDFSYCDNTVGYCKSGHIRICEGGDGKIP